VFVRSSSCFVTVRERNGGENMVRKKRDLEPRYILPAPYENLPESYWADHTRTSKYIIKWDFPCYICCIKSENCEKLHAIEEVQEELKVILETTLDMNMKDAIKDSRMKMLDLTLDALIIREEIRRCIYVQKRLTTEGYPIWYD